MKNSFVAFAAGATLAGPASAAALATLMVDPAAVTGQPAQPIEFVIHVSTNQSIGALQFTLEYDANVAAFQGAALDPSMPAGFVVSNVNADLPFAPSSPGATDNVLVQITGNGIDDSFTGEQDVARLTFLFAAGTCGVSPMNFDPVCQRTHLSTIGLVPICDPLLLNGSISDCPTDGPAPAHSVRLLENVPNPFNPSTVIRFELATPADARLQVFDISGRPVRMLLSGRTGAGLHEVVWNGRDDAGNVLPSSVYVYELATPEGRATRRAILLK